MAVRIAVEEFLTPEIVPPIQFQRIWRASATKTPERTLAVSVLKYRYAGRRSRQRLYMDAYGWVASNDRSWPYSFLSLCDASYSATSLAAAPIIFAEPGGEFFAQGELMPVSVLPMWPASRESS